MMGILLCSVSFSQSAYKAKPKFTLQGKVYKQTDSLQPKEIIMDAMVTVVGSDGSFAYDTTNSKGEYFFDNKKIQAGTKYEMKVEARGYFGCKAKISTLGLNKNKKFIQDFYLVEIPRRGDPFPAIYYDSTEWKLNLDYQDSLKSFTSFLKDNPGLVIEIGAHSDNPGSLAYNDSLAYLRVKFIAEYFVTNGIAGDRLVPYAYGRRVPLTLYRDIMIDGFTFEKGTILTEDVISKFETGQQKNAAHKLNSRIEFRILRSDYVPKK